jgi:hypothetical protein
LPEEFGGAATGVPTVFATFRSDRVGFFFDRRTSLPRARFWDATALDASEIGVVGWAALEGAAKATITNAAEIDMFVFMNKKIEVKPLKI